MGELEGLDLFGTDASHSLAYDAKRLGAFATIGRRIADYAQREDEAGLLFFVTKYIERTLGEAPTPGAVKQKTTQALQHLDLIARFTDAMQASPGRYDDPLDLWRDAFVQADKNGYAGKITEFYRAVSSKFDSQK